MKINFNHPCVCRIELSNPGCLTVVCKRGSVEFTYTVRQRGLESSTRHTQGWLKLMFILIQRTLLYDIAHVKAPIFIHHKVLALSDGLFYQY